MNEPTRAGVIRRLPRGLLGMLGLMLVIETGIARHDPALASKFQTNWDLKTRSSATTARGAEVLFLGDSQVVLGIVPRVIEERLGRRAYNLAVIAGQAPSTYSLFRRALAAGARPKMVVVDFTPHLLSQGPRENLRNWSALLSVGENLELAWAARDAGFLGETMLMRAFPSFRNRWALRSFARALTRGQSDQARREVLAYRRNWVVNDGAELNAHLPGRTCDPDFIPHLLFPTDGWRCDPVNEAYVERILNLADAHGVQVCWLLPPIESQTTTRRAAMGLEATQTEFVQSFQKRHPTLTVIDSRAKGYEESVFCDLIHLDAQGALALSLAVGDALRELSEGTDPPRWIDLPRYRNPSAGPPFENLDQSRLVLQAATETPRR